MKIMHGWYSQKAFDQNRLLHVYQIANESGTVLVTSVGSSRSLPPSKFGDEVYVCKVDRWVRNVVNYRVAPDASYIIRQFQKH